MKANLSLLFTLFLLLSFRTEAQKYVYSHGSNLEAWFTCDTASIAFNISDEGWMQAKVYTNTWSCLGLAFQELNINDYEAFEINLKVNAPVPLTYGSMMFRFKDTNGYMSIDPEENTFPVEISKDFTKIYMRLDEDATRFIHSEGAFNGSVTNSLLIYFRFEVEIPEDIFAEIMIDSIRFY